MLRGLLRAQLPPKHLLPSELGPSHLQVPHPATGEARSTAQRSRDHPQGGEGEGPQSLLWAGCRRGCARVQGQGQTSGGKGQSTPGVHTERRLQGMPRLGAPARRVDVRVVSINPEVIGVTPAIKVELGRKGPGGQVFLVEPSSAGRSSRLQEALPIPGACQKQDPELEGPKGQPHNNPSRPPHCPRVPPMKLLACMHAKLLQSCPTLWDPMNCSLPTRLLCLRGFSRQEYWSGLPSFLQGIFLTQGLNPWLLYCRWILYC